MEDIDAIRAAVEARCGAIGRRVAAVVNCDAFRLAEGSPTPTPSWCATWRTATTSAFLRLKLGQILTRRVAPHIFEIQDEARASYHRAEAG